MQRKKVQHIINQHDVGMEDPLITVKFSLNVQIRVGELVACQDMVTITYHRIYKVKVEELVQ